MKILVINIRLRPNAIRKLFPIGLGYIVSAIKRAGFDFDLLDLDAHPQPPKETEKFLLHSRYDVIMFGCIVTGYRYVKWLSSTIKKAFPETAVIVGNSVASSIPGILLAKTPVDIAVLGEGDMTITELLHHLENKQDLVGVKGICYRKNGRVVATADRAVIEAIDSIPNIDWDIFDVQEYIESFAKTLNEPLPPLPRDQIRPMSLNTARGCPFNCTFCYHVFRGQKYRYRSAQSVVSEMRSLNERYGINYFTFNDELTFFSSAQAEAFADAVSASGLKVYWDAECRSGLFTEEKHIAIAKKLKEAGCVFLGFSLESSNADILKWMNKRVDANAFSRQVQIMREVGLIPNTAIVLGYPNETEETIKATIDFCTDNGLYPSAGYILPQPGTPMYEYALSNGHIKDEEEYLLHMGDRQDLHVNMTKMSNEELEGIVKRELNRCGQVLGLNLGNNQLLKTGFARSPKVKP